MLKKFVIFSQNGLSKKKLALVAGTVIAIILCLVAYIAILEPIVSRFLLTTTSIHEGMDHYKNQTYLEFESGDRFHEVLNTMDSLKHGTAVDFYHVDNHFCFEHSYLTKLFYDSELKVINLKRFWKGFQPKLTPKDIQMLINKIELLEEDIECVHLYLDNIGIDRKDGDKMLSIVGRIKKMNNN